MIHALPLSQNPTIKKSMVQETALIFCVYLFILSKTSPKSGYFNADLKYRVGNL